MAKKNLYVLLNNDSPNPILWEQHNLLSLMGEFNEPICSWTSQKHGLCNRRIWYHRQQPGPVARDISLAGAVIATPFWLRPQEKLFWDPL